MPKSRRKANPQKTGRKSLSAKRYEFWARPDVMGIIEQIPRYHRSHYINLSIRERWRIGPDGNLSIIQYAAKILKVDEKKLIRFCTTRSELPISELIRVFIDENDI